MGKCKNEQEVMETPEYVRYKGELQEILGVDYEEKLYLVRPMEHEPNADDKQWVRWESTEKVGPSDEVLQGILDFAHNYPVNPIDVEVMYDNEDFVPEYKTSGSAGCDLKADIKEPLTLMPGDIACVPTGIRIALPKGLEAQIRPRSGLAVKYGVTIVNSPGTIDSDYRGVVHAPLINLGKDPYTIQPGERIAQMLIEEYGMAVWHRADNLDDTERGDGAFGHTGK